MGFSGVVDPEVRSLALELTERARVDWLHVNEEVERLPYRLLGPLMVESSTFRNLHVFRRTWGEIQYRRLVSQIPAVSYVMLTTRRCEPLECCTDLAGGLGLSAGVRLRTQVAADLRALLTPWRHPRKRNYDMALINAMESLVEVGTSDDIGLAAAAVQRLSDEGVARLGWMALDSPILMAVLRASGR
jgi:hypothetical protein